MSEVVQNIGIFAIRPLGLSVGVSMSICICVGVGMGMGVFSEALKGSFLGEPLRVVFWIVLVLDLDGALEIGKFGN